MIYIFANDFLLVLPKMPERRLEQNTSTQFLTVHLQGLKTTCGPLRLTLGRINFGVRGGGGRRDERNYILGKERFL